MLWYPNRPYRTPITSQNAKVLEAVTNGYIDLAEFASAGFHAHAKDGGADVRITKADGATEVAREIVSCDTVAEIGEIHFDCTGIQTGSDVLWWLYYGDPAASDYAEDAEFGREAVWDVNHRAIYHAKDLTTSTILDSTDADHDGAKLGVNQPIEAAAKIEKGQHYDGSNDFIQVGSTADFKYLHGGEDQTDFKFTVAWWASLDVPEPNDIMGWFSTARVTFSVVGVDFFLEDRTAQGSRRLRLMINNGNAPEPVISLLSNNNVYPNDTNQHFLVVSYDQSLGANNANIYVDDVLVATGTKTAQAPSAANSAEALHLGSIGDENWELDGKEDEMRFSDVVRSVNWMTTVYNNQNDPSTFWSVGAEETIIAPQVVMI